MCHCRLTYYYFLAITPVDAPQKQQFMSTSCQLITYCHTNMFVRGLCFFDSDTEGHFNIMSKLISLS